MSLLESFKGSILDLFKPFGESKVKHKVRLEEEGHKIWLILDVSGHTIKERLPRQVLKMENEQTASLFIDQVCRRLAMKAQRKGLLTDID